MKGTIVLLASNETENYGRKLMYEANKAGNIGFEMARLPQHVSLKQPFSIPSLQEFEAFFDRFAKTVPPFTLKFEDLEVFPTNILGGIPSGCMSLRVHRNELLYKIQSTLFQQLEDHFGPCPAEYDNNYIFHMTIAIGGAPYDNYEKAYQTISDLDFNREFLFDKLGLLYYDDDNIKPGTYFCYKIAQL